MRLNGHAKHEFTAERQPVILQFGRQYELRELLQAASCLGRGEVLAAMAVGFALGAAAATAGMLAVWMIF